MLEKATVILASASPRRTELLKQAGIAHIIMPATCDEQTSATQPEQYVMELAERKATDVLACYVKDHSGESVIVIGSDTVVSVDGKILGKPKTEEEAFTMLSSLQNHTHQVYTGVAVLENKNRKETKKVFCERSDVEVYPMTKEEILSYIKTGDCMDKAGAYGVQGHFAIYIKGIHGDYNNIVGLPIARLYQELKHES